MKKCFVLRKEVIDVFHEKYYIPIIEKLLFHLAHVRILGAMECGNFRNDCFHIIETKKTIKRDYGENLKK